MRQGVSGDYPLRRGQADDVALLVNGFFIFVCLRGFKLYRFVTERQIGKLSVWRLGIVLSL